MWNGKQKKIKKKAPIQKKQRKEGRKKKQK